MRFEHDLGDGLALRMYDSADADEVYAVVDANRERLAQWHAFAAPATPETIQQWIAEVRAAAAADESLACMIARDGRMVGSTGFQPVDWENGVVEIGYWLAAGEEGRGTVSRAVRALVDHAFGVWDLGRVQILCAVQNARSRAVPERLGFTYEGTLRHAERIEDRVHDLAVYGLLREEWGEGPAGGS